jgi:hypothetical protein
MHIEFGELVRTRIPAFRGRDERNNRLVLETIALQGPLIKYDIFKALKQRNIKHYPTISRRVDDLKKKGYIAPAGKRIITVGKRTDESPTYGLTWRGLIASLVSDEVARQVSVVLKSNPLLEIPFPKEIAIRVLNEIFTQRETEIVVRALLEGFLIAIPRDIESIEQEKYMAYLVPAIVETPTIREKFEEKDLTKLFQIPGFLEFVVGLVNASERQLSDMLAGVQTIKKELSAHIKAKQNASVR